MIKVMAVAKFLRAKFDPMKELYTTKIVKNMRIEKQ